MALPEIKVVHRAAKEPSDKVFVHRWTREEYERIARKGGFSDRRVELVDGVIYDMSPQSGRHAKGIVLANQVLMAAFGPGYHIRPQLPLALGEDSLPEPDVAVIAGSPADYDDHPSAAVLVLEVADTSDRHDGGPKSRAYAKASIPDYWIVSLRRACVEVLREPQGDVYRKKMVFQRGDQVSPLARPEISIAVEDLLPSR